MGKIRKTSEEITALIGRKWHPCPECGSKAFAISHFGEVRCLDCFPAFQQDASRAAMRAEVSQHPFTGETILRASRDIERENAVLAFFRPYYRAIHKIERRGRAEIWQEWQFGDNTIFTRIWADGEWAEVSDLENDLRQRTREARVLEIESSKDGKKQRSGEPGEAKPPENSLKPTA